MKAMKLAVAFAIALCGAFARADTQTVDGVTWTYVISGGKATVGGGSWQYKAVPKDTAGAIAVPSELGGCPVVAIGNSAFSACRNLTSVTIPEGVTDFGREAFQDCWSLKSVTMPEGAKCISYRMFGGCSSLKSVTIPKGVECIGDMAFNSCSELESLSIPSSVTNIGVDAFWYCDKLGAFTVDAANSSYASLDGVLYDKSMTTLVQFPNARESVAIPEGVTRIGDSAFRTCSALKSVTIPEWVTSIGDAAFNGSSALKSVRMLGDGKSIGYSAFGECGALETVTISGSVTSIGGFAFSSCPALRTVTISGNVTSIGDCAFCGVLASVTFGGDAPTEVGKGIYGGTPADFVTYVRPGSTGWNGAGSTDLPELWPVGDGDARAIRYANEFETVVPGEKVEIDTGLVGYAASGLPSGLRYDRNTGKITGAATKPTAAEGAVVTFKKAGEPDETLTIVVTAIPTVAVSLAGVNSPSDADGCKVTGTGAYLVGKEVTLKATAPKGVVFVGWFDGESAVGTLPTYSFTMGKEDVALVAKFKKEVMSVDCKALSSKGPLPAGVAGAEGGIELDISTESGVKSVKVEKLPAGMKYDAKTGLIIGAPTKAGDSKVVITVTAKSGAVARKEIEVAVAAMPDTAVGKFDGFVSVGGDNLGTFTLTTTDAGKLTAKVVTVAGAVSFSGTCWDAVENGVYRVTLATKKGERLTLALDSKAAWDENQLAGEFVTAAVAETRTSAAVPARVHSLSAQRNAFGKTWHFAATGDETTGWTLAYAESAKAAALTVTLKADGTVSIAGTLPGAKDAKGKATAFKVSASGYANVGGMREGALVADFAPVLTVNKVKTVLAISTNLWFDRSNDHGPAIGEARFVR